MPKTPEKSVLEEIVATTEPRRRAELCRKHLKFFPRNKFLLIKLRDCLNPKWDVDPEVEDLRYTAYEGWGLFKVSKPEIQTALTRRIAFERPEKYEINAEQYARITQAIETLNFKQLLPEDYRNTPLEGRSIDIIIDTIAEYEISAILARKLLNENPQDKKALIVLRDSIMLGAQIQPSDLRGTTHENGGMKNIGREDFRRDLLEKLLDIINPDRGQVALDNLLDVPLRVVYNQYGNERFAEREEKKVPSLEDSAKKQIHKRSKSR